MRVVYSTDTLFTLFYDLNIYRTTVVYEPKGDQLFHFMSSLPLLGSVIQRDHNFIPWAYTTYLSITLVSQNFPRVLRYAKKLLCSALFNKKPRVFPPILPMFTFFIPSFENHDNILSLPSSPFEKTSHSHAATSIWYEESSPHENKEIIQIVKFQSHPKYQSFPQSPIIEFYPLQTNSNNLIPRLNLLSP